MQAVKLDLKNGLMFIGVRRSSDANVIIKTLDDGKLSVLENKCAFIENNLVKLHLQDGLMLTVVSNIESAKPDVSITMLQDESFVIENLST